MEFNLFMFGFVCLHAKLKKENPQSFDQLAKLIKEHGIKEQFQGTTYTYLYYKGYTYWHTEIVINRGKLQICSRKTKG